MPTSRLEQCANVGHRLLFQKLPIDCKSPLVPSHFLMVYPRLISESSHDMRQSFLNVEGKLVATNCHNWLGPTCFSIVNNPHFDNINPLTHLTQPTRLDPQPGRVLCQLQKITYIGTNVEHTSFSPVHSCPKSYVLHNMFQSLSCVRSQPMHTC